MNLMGNRVTAYLVQRLILNNPRLQVALTRLRARDEDRDIELYGAPLRINLRKEFSYLRVYKREKGTYAHELGQLLTSMALILEPKDTFVDVGANVGLYSSTMSKLRYIYPSMRFYAIEANPDTVTRLRESVKDRGVEVLDIALASAPGTLDFAQGSSSLVFGVKSHAKDGYMIEGPTQSVAARTLDSLGLVGDSIVLKLSVRGFERDVLEGASGLIKAGRVKAIFTGGYSDLGLPDHIASLGFELYDANTMEPGLSKSILAIHRSRLDS